MRPERVEYRIQLSDVDRHIDAVAPIVLSRHASETVEHLTLRVLAFALLYEDGLSFGPGICIGEAPDLWAHDLTGAVRLWVACGWTSPDTIRKVRQQHRDARVHVVVSQEEDHVAMVAAIDRQASRLADRPPVQIWSIPQPLVDDLAAITNLRQKWAITIVADHIYIDAGEARTFDAPISRG